MGFSPCGSHAVPVATRVFSSISKDRQASSEDRQRSCRHPHFWPKNAKIAKIANQKHMAIFTALAILTFGPHPVFGSKTKIARHVGWA